MKWKRDIWTNYLSDYNKVLASNQSGGGKHPLGLPPKEAPPKEAWRKRSKVSGERKWTDQDREVVKLYGNPDPAMQVVGRYEENAEDSDRRAGIKDARKYACLFDAFCDL